MRQPLIEYRREHGGVETRVLELEGGGPPLLLFHGYADSADTWRLALDRLAKHDRRVVAVDLPGFGQADRLDRQAPILEQLDAFGSAVVRDLAEEHGPVVVGGNSLGGCLTLRLAQDPDLPIVSAIPVAPAGFDHPVWFRAIEGDRLVRMALRAPLPGPLFRAVVGEAYRQLAFARPRAQQGDVVALFAQHLSTQRDVRRILATGSRMLPELHHPFRLREIGVPVLLIWGDRDRMVAHTGAKHLLAALPDTRHEVLEGIGHCPQVEDPDRFVELVLDFAPASALAGRP